ncbi:hypothetical protein ACIGMX_16170 [Streptomyces aquilus]|uniref:hypothetical protein n=1 Tax=Streptomyces aquilus TaxID=2548456 RepID=UPI0037D5BA72
MTTHTEPARYRRCTPEVEAVQWTGDNADAVSALVSPFDFQLIDPEDRGENPDQTAAIRESEHGTWRGLAPGDWAVKRGQDYFACSAADFARLYEPAGVAPATDEPWPSRRAGLRDDIAAALADALKPRYGGPQHNTPGGLPLTATAEEIRLHRAQPLADAALAVLYREWPWLRAETEQAAAEPFPIWTVWREDQPIHGQFATEDIAKQASIDCWEEDEPSCPDYSWRKDGPRLELVVGGEASGVYMSRDLVYGGLPQPPRADVYREVADRLAADAEQGAKEGFTRIYRRSAARQVREWADELAVGTGSATEPADETGETAPGPVQPAEGDARGATVLQPTVKASSARYAEELRRAPGEASADGHAGWECAVGASLIVRAETPGPGRLGMHHGAIYTCTGHQSAAEERIAGGGYQPQTDPAPAGHRWDPWPCGHVTAYNSQALTVLQRSAGDPGTGSEALRQETSEPHRAGEEA